VPALDARAETVLPATVASPSVARRFASAALRRWGVDEHVVATEQLLVSEVVTNAIVHTGSEVRIDVHRRGSRIRTEVSDTGQAIPVLGHPPLEHEHGRGLAIVDHLAAAWGSCPRAAGKAVWFELDV
jgi:anti-sigma regulatory factor (Ser/Thr protein kinase)